MCNKIDDRRPMATQPFMSLSIFWYFWDKQKCAIIAVKIMWRKFFLSISHCELDIKKATIHFQIVSFWFVL